MLKLAIRNYRRSLRLAWGRAWVIRNAFIPASMIQRSHEYLDQNQEKMIFVIGSGRSGTQLISDLINSSGRASVYHEPNFKEDVGAMDILKTNHEMALKYWREFRGYEVYRRWMSQPYAEIYGEVNGTIRFQTRAISEVFPKAKTFLLARDGRGVVRSVMGWPQFYASDAKGAYALAPDPGEKYYDEWSNMTRFERLCWGWMDTNEYLMRWIPRCRWIQLEKVTTDYGYFNETFAAQAGIEISCDEWARHVRKKSRNSTRKYDYPAWEDWGSEEKAAFDRICGSTMEKLGYAI